MTAFITKYWKLLLNAGALVSVLFLVHEHSFILSELILALLVVILGYYFGSITCHSHKSSHGIIATIILFSVFNISHSLIDGVVAQSNTSVTSMMLHELARQPALYIILAGMISPFKQLERNKLFVLPIFVTGIWFAGLLIGKHIGTLPAIEQYVDIGVYLFVGDILHHLIEEYKKLTQPKTCCH